MALLCIFIGACQKHTSQPSGDTATTETLEPSSSNAGAPVVTDEQTNTTEPEHPPGIDTEACCENEEPPNAVAEEEVLPPEESEAEQGTTENMETEEE